MRKLASCLSAAAVAVGVSLGAGGGAPDAGIVLAQSGVPDTGSAQGVNPSNSLPGGNTAFGASSTTSPTPHVAPPPSGAAQGVMNAPNGQDTGALSSSSGTPSAPSAAADASGTQRSSTR